MGAHILLTSETNFAVCTSRGVYGCVMPAREWNKAEIVAGILSIQPGDQEIGDETLSETFDLLVDGKRLRDISDLPFDLAI